MRRIVVGFDGSVSATAALSWAVDEARLHDADLVVRSVLGQSGDGSETLNELRRVVKEVTGDHPADFRPGHGAAAAELIATCADTDLLVLGTRGRDPFAGLLLGSVSRTCLHRAPCPVVIVGARPDPRPRHGRVIVGVDASADARQALRVATEEARLRGAALHAVHAVRWEHVGAELLEPTKRQLIDWGRQLVTAELANAGVTARPLIVHGHPADVLVRHSPHADLLVLGSRGRTPLAGLLLGSTSDYCANHAECPVMIVRAPGSVEPQ